MLLRPAPAAVEVLLLRLLWPTAPEVRAQLLVLLLRMRRLAPASPALQFLRLVKLTAALLLLLLLQQLPAVSSAEAMKKLPPLQ